MPKIAHTRKECTEEFTGFYALQQHKSKVLGQSFKTSCDSSPLLDAFDDDNLKQELRVCQHFLVDSNWKMVIREFSISHWIFSVLQKLIPSWIMCFNNSNVLLKLIWLFDLFEKISKTLAVVFNAQEKSTLLEKSEMLSTVDYLEHIKKLLAGKDFIETCTRERVNTKWKFLNLTNVTKFAARLQDVPLVYKDAVLVEPLLQNRIVNCFTFEQNTRQPYIDNLCLFRALCLHLHRKERLEEETNKVFIHYLQK